MKTLLLIAIGSAVVNNVVLSQFLGICPFLGVSKKTETAAGMGGAVIFVIGIASLVTSLIYKFILTPTDTQYLQTIVFILVIAALVQFVEMFLKKSMPSLGFAEAVAATCTTVSPYRTRHSPFASWAILPVSTTRGRPAKSVS